MEAQEGKKKETIKEEPKRKEEDVDLCRNKEDERKIWLQEKFMNKRLVMTLVGFGTGMFGKSTVRMKRQISGVAGVLYKTLLNRQKQQLVAVVDVDDYCTSQIGAGARCYSTKVFWVCHGKPSQFIPQNCRSEDGAVDSSNQAA
ncbi:hypothetical protein BDF20DRAFT_864360 [Mycotypha africana]|uniref:uncharacterized protein n=1 Tax=Mycotypha africana TaxID=64632 RepID=UPI0023005086|nr:uncharacterized protein BDF20DRAFT_864360 [Mycotypha africana]KAI8981971.1 hypothetical protein BDF20DRAFT_864360 [Mycotypha africana]